MNTKQTSPQVIEKTFILLLMHKTLVDLMSDFCKTVFSSDEKSPSSTKINIRYENHCGHDNFVRLFMR